MVSKMSPSAQKVTEVPVSSVASCRASGAVGTPSLYSCVQRWPSVLTSTATLVERALTTETPTPCRPPETA
ncbi:hypothetical protein STENM223S_11283 [Streptomyces tendae]